MEGLEIFPMKFTYPFCYTPSPEVLSAADSLMKSGCCEPFEEGKMLGVLVTDKGPLFAFSGSAGGKSVIEGFVPPIFDLSDPKGYYKIREAEISSMSSGPERAAASAELQDWIFDQYRVHNALGEELSIKEVFALRGLVPPGGTGECAAPKLLEFAYRNGLKPISMGEFWYGESPEAEVREQGRFYPSCTGKCGPLLSWMMRGLDVEPNPLDKGFASTEPSVLYEDEYLIVADKPSGMLSVPGRTDARSLLDYLRGKYGHSIESCHRLDMDTSGLIVFAKNIDVKSRMEAKFAAGEVTKMYKARLAAGTRPFSRAKKGTIALPLALDYYDRPRQMVDDKNGKRAITEYEVLSQLPSGETEVRFKPLTGRTHQLRVHSAHERGLGHPIKGDRLYGDSNGGRLWLDADYIQFSHPVTGEKIIIKK